MSLSAYPASTGTALGEDWGDSPYGSLASLGARKFKKKPVLVLDPEELASAHMAMALGGAEIMEAMPDPTVAPRPRQPASLLGLAPIGHEDDDDLALYPAAARTAPTPAPFAADLLAADFVAADEDEIEEDGPPVSWTPEDEPDEWLDAPLAGPAADLPLAQPPVAQSPAVLAGSVIPSIEEQLRRMREKTARTVPPAPEPAPPAMPPVPTIQRLEIDDWGQLGALNGFVPPREADVTGDAPVPDRVPPPVAARPEPDAPEPAALASGVDRWPEPSPEYAPEPAAQPAPVLLEAAWDEADETGWDLDAATDRPPVPGQVPSQPSALRARLVDHADLPADMHHDAPRESLLARLWVWLTRRR